MIVCIYKPLLTNLDMIMYIHVVLNVNKTVSLSEMLVFLFCQATMCV